ncbi:hypothetical protein ONE63_005994 [Megalurothrips usitatus]|uniref:Partial AB-hydrolase lipase domain-containing protein n=1 Tax=Megalurothrips usitatus TaxID=439358 RepID=A0AAV7XS03_9NEOP|nr:hypothetical protein ONE63_005994 [Megalurothrips usitatus]
MAPRAPWSRLLLLACAATVLAPLAAAMSSPDADEQHTWWQVKEQETGEQLPRAAVEDTQTAAPQQQQQQQQLGRRSVIGTANLAAEHGYTAENHTVRTADGFLLTLFRLVGPAAPASAASARPPVLLAHALLGSSADFLVLGKGRALDAGFDVWLFNARGTTPSKKHEHLSPAHAKFWDFSWHEIGVLDLPASIDYVLKATNQSQVRVRPVTGIFHDPPLPPGFSKI